MKTLTKKQTLNQIIKLLKKRYLDIEKADYYLAKYKLSAITPKGFIEELTEPDKLIIEFKSPSIRENKNGR